MNKSDTRAEFKAWIEDENSFKRIEFHALGSGKRRYTSEQKEYAIEKAISIGVRATSRLLHMHRKTVQRWLRTKGIRVKRCPDWVYSWAYWRKKRREKWERIKAYRGY